MSLANGASTHGPHAWPGASGTAPARPPSLRASGKPQTFVAGLRRMDRSAGCARRTDQPPRLRYLRGRCWCPSCGRRHRDHGQLSSHKGPSALGVIEAAGAPAPPAALLTRLQPDRERLRQTQGAPAQGGRANHRRALGQDRPHPQSLHARRSVNYFAATGYDASLNRFSFKLHSPGHRDFSSRSTAASGDGRRLDGTARARMLTTGVCMGQ